MGLNMKKCLMLLICVTVTGILSAAEQESVISVESEKQFSEVTSDKDKLVIVDFFAVWCPSCSVVIKSLKEVHSNANGKTTLAKVDFSKQQKLAEKYGVTSVPTVLFFKGGKQLYKLENLCTTKDYQTVVSGLIKEGKVPADFVPEGHKQAMGISAKQAKDLIDNSGAVVLDVRSDHEFSRGHLEHAIHIPVNSIESRVDELKDFKKRNIVVYCLSGYRSAIACEILAEKGYKIFNMARGIGDWNRSGYKLVR